MRLCSNISVAVAFSLLILSCSVVADEGDSTSVSSSYPLRCTLNANSHDSCLKLKGCSWCQAASLPGICASGRQVKALIHKIPHVKCWHENDGFLKEQEPSLLRTTSFRVTEYNEDDRQAVTPYDPKCLNAPSMAGPNDVPADICNTTPDSQGQFCVWCDAAGVFDLCLSHEQAEASSSYLQCDFPKLEV